MNKAGGRVGGNGLDDLERDHLSGDFGEALHASADVDESFRVDVNDVARAVPTFADRTRRLNDTGLVMQEIALHDVGTLHVQDTATVDPGYGLELVGHARNDLTDATDAAGHRHVDGDDRGAFGHAIAFEHTNAELLDPGAPDLI